MTVLWVTLGIVVLVALLADISLTCLAYDESGFIAIPLCTLLWRLLRFFTRRLSPRWRPHLARQTTGLQLGLCLVTWLGIAVIAFGFIYFGAMQGRNFAYAGHDLHPGLFAAFYLSAAQLSTVGTSQVAAQTDLLRAVTVLETLNGLILITLTLTFLLGIYQVVRALSALCAGLPNVKADPDNAVTRLRPFFPHGQPTGLAPALKSLHDNLSAYVDGMRLHRLAYFFQSGRDQYSLPYAIDLLGALIGALRWGLPAGHPAAEDPALAALTLRFTEFLDFLAKKLHCSGIRPPEGASSATFARARGGARPASDPWLEEFLRLDDEMRALTHGESGDSLESGYDRYLQWLPFAFRAERISAAVHHDLDYQLAAQPHTPAGMDKP